jgi:hypothetical protein
MKKRILIIFAVLAIAGYASAQQQANVKILSNGSPVSASNPLPTNCVTGCAGGTSVVDADALANQTAPTNLVFAHVFNGTTWDRIRGDLTNGVWVNLKSSIVQHMICDSGCGSAAAVAMADSTSNPTIPQTAAFGMVWNTATWDRLRGDSTSGAWVNIKASVGIGRSWTLASGTDSVSASVSNFPSTYDTSDRAARLLGHTVTDSGSVTSATITTDSVGLAKDATLTGGGAKAIARGGAKGSTTAADVTSENVDANTQALHVFLKNTTISVIGTFWQTTQPVSIAATVDTNLKNYNGSAVGAANALHVQPGTSATWDVSDRSARLLGHAILDASSAKIGVVTTDQTTHGTTDLVADDITKIGGSALTAKAVPSGGVGQTAIPVYSNAVQLATYTIVADSIASGALTANTRKDVLSIEHGAGAAKTVKIRRIQVGGFQTTALVGTVYCKIFRGTAATSAGTGQTPTPTNPGTAAAEMVAKTLPTITAATLVYTNSVGFISTATAQTGFPMIAVYDWQEEGETQPLQLRAANLDTLVIAIYSNVAHNLTLQISVIATEE